MKTKSARFFVSILSFFEDCLEVIRTLLLTEAARERRWIKRGRDCGATHLIILWEGSEMDSLPRYVMPGEDVQVIARNTQQAGAFSVSKVIAL